MRDVQLKVLDARLRGWGLPDYKTEMAAGIDLAACLEAPLAIHPQAPAVLIPTGLSIFLNDPNAVAMIYPRSGLGHKRGLVLGNGTGVIDADYQNQLFVSAWNRNPDGAPITIEPGDRIAQLVLMPVVRARFVEVEAFEAETARGLGGFGSTGVAA